MNFLIKYLNRAQISLFVIIGVIVLAVGVSAFTFFSSSTIFQNETPGFRVQEFTQQCLLQQAEFALNEVAKRGGWYYTKGNEIFARQNDFNPLITRAQGFEHSFYGNLKYWDHFDENQNTFKNQIPSLDDPNDPHSIKNQVIRLMEETIDEHCIQEYSSFSEVYLIERQINNMEITSTSFERNRIVFEMYLPVQIETFERDSFESLDRFRVDIDNKILIPYYIANDIVLAQKNTSFIEQAYLDFIYNYQKTGDPNFLPPFYDFRYGVADYSVIYAEDKKPLLQRIFNTHSREIIIKDRLALTPEQQDTVMNTNNAILKPLSTHHHPRLFTDLTGSMLESQRLNTQYSKYVASLNYEPFFPISFSFSNGKGSGQVLTNSVFNEVLLIVPVQYTTYQAGYDVTVPVLYEIRDSSNIRDNFVFNLPLEINIRNNNPLRGLIAADYRLNSLQVEETFAPTYCNPTHFISQDISIDISKYEEFPNKEPLEDVSFSFYCSTQPTVACQVPIKEKIERLNSQTYIMNLPINCPESEIEITKNGYLSQRVQVSPSINEEIVLEPVTMIKPVTLPFSFYVNGRGVKETEDAIIIFEPRNNPEHIQVLEINSTFNQLDMNITLVPDIYKITAFVIDNSDGVIPERRGERRCSGPFGTFCTRTPDLPEIELGGWVILSYEVDNYIITYGELQNVWEIYTDFQGLRYPIQYSDLENAEMPRSDRDAITIRRRTVND